MDLQNDIDGIIQLFLIIEYPIIFHMICLRIHILREGAWAVVIVGI